MITNTLPLLSSRIRRTASLAMALAFLASCESESPVTQAVLTAIHVTIAAPSVQVAQTTTATAGGLDQHGAPSALSNVIWSSTNTQVATVSAAGQITAVAPGQAEITATSGAISGRATLTVVAIPVGSVAIETLFPSVPLVFSTIAEKQQFTVVLRGANGAPLSGRVVTWTSLNPNIVAINANGQATSVAIGSTTITATSEGKSGSVEVIVVHIPVVDVEITPLAATLAPGHTMQLTVKTYSNTRAALPGRVVTWTSSDTSKARVDANGVITAVAPGAVTITATCEGQVGRAEVVVAPTP
jgi:trimeric autotransporter adhesin